MNTNQIDTMVNSLMALVENNRMIVETNKQLVSSLTEHFMHDHLELKEKYQALRSVGMQIYEGMEEGGAETLTKTAWHTGLKNVLFS